MTTNPCPPALVDRDNDRLSITVTFDWRRPWALDHCEAGVIVGEIARVLGAHFADADWNQLAALRSVETWEPCEERHVGMMRDDGRPRRVFAREGL
jgi:hypothetical protein